MRALWDRENRYHVAYDIGYRKYSKQVAQLKIMARRQTRHKIDREVQQEVENYEMEEKEE